MLSREQTRITTDARLLAEVSSRFTRTSAMVLRGFLAPPLLSWVQGQVSRGAFAEKVHDASGVEECMANEQAVWLLRFLLSARNVLDAVESMTGAGPLSKCQVRIYRFQPDSGQRHDWHDDVGEGRRLGLSVNLSEHEFTGGNLQVRERASGAVIADVRNTGPGDAVIFRLGRDVQHQVLPVTGQHPRVALAGWFRT